MIGLASASCAAQAEKVRAQSPYLLVHGTFESGLARERCEASLRASRLQPCLPQLRAVDPWPQQRMEYGISTQSVPTMLAHARRVHQVAGDKRPFWGATHELQHCFCHDQRKPCIETSPCDSCLVAT